MKGQRLRLLKISPHVLLPMMIQGAETNMRVMENGLPPDARMTGAHYDPREGCFLIQVESEQFSELKQGETIPFLSNPVFVRPDLHISTTEIRGL